MQVIELFEYFLGERCSYKKIKKLLMVAFPYTFSLISLWRLSDLRGGFEYNQPIRIQTRDFNQYGE